MTYELVEVMPHPDAASPIYAQSVDITKGKAFLIAKMGDCGSKPAMTMVEM